MPIKHIITDQSISAEFGQRARELRHSMTPAEQILWQRLRAGRLAGFHFRRQQMIDRFIVDFYCHQADLVVEVDGGVHLAQEEYDRARDDALSALGLRVLRFTNDEITHHMDLVLSAILESCNKTLD